MSDNEILVSLYNRLSYYLCFGNKDENIEIRNEMTIEELQNELDKFYTNTKGVIKNESNEQNK